MSLRGEAHRAAIRAVVDAFGDDAASFVFVGGCTLGLYARTTGAPLRVTKDAGDGRTVMAITPPYFLATKLAAFEDRGPDAQSSRDMEDIVALVVEVADIVEQVDAAGMRAALARLWTDALIKYGLAVGDLPDLVDWHLDRREADSRQRVISALDAIARR